MVGVSLGDDLANDLADTDQELAGEAFTHLRELLSEASTRPAWEAASRSDKAHVIARLVLLRLAAERLSPDETLTVAAELASLHPDLVSEGTRGLRALLATVAVGHRLVEELAGHPRQIVTADEIADSVLRQAKIAGEAMGSIWEYPMLAPSAAALALGAKPGNREKVRTYRLRSWLLGLPRRRGYVYPRFQFDPKSLELFSEVQSANEVLGAADDPWGVASWWISSNERLGCRPAELVGTERASDVVRAAQALLEPVG